MVRLRAHGPPPSRCPAPLERVLSVYIEKIEVPAFRALRDVMLEFGGVYDPQVFPLGSENGGGKSTLLQLVFTLLHCSAKRSRHIYLSNLLTSDSSATDAVDGECLLARLTVRIDGQSHALEFVSLHERFLAEKLDDPPRFGFETKAELARPREERDANFTVSSAGYRSDAQRVPKAKLRADLERINGLMVALNYRPILIYQPTRSDLRPRGLICRSHGESPSTIRKLLAVASEKVFLLGPSNQQYLFLGMNTRKLLGGPPSFLQQGEEEEEEEEDEEETPVRPQIEYLTELERAERGMAGFYAYDWLSVTPLIQLFESALKEDFKNVVKTGGYGSNYQSLAREVNGLLVGKTVRPLADLSGVEFIVVDDSGLETSLGPEDLSQGELKRLMMFAWLRANTAVDALVLIDEIESSFHPDWQVGIVRDLQEWAPKNQYILATHSHELCQAVTPRHVRELQPRLRRGEAPQNDSGHG